MKNALVYTSKTIALISQWLNFFGMAILGALMLLTVIDVLGRSLFKKPILGTFELTEYMLSVIVFSTFAWCAVRGEHIKVDILTSHLKPKVQIFLSLITYLISLGLLSIITWQCFLESVVMTNLGKTSAILHVPAYPFYWIMTTGFFVLCLQVLTEIFQYVIKVLKQ